MLLEQNLVKGTLTLHLAAQLSHNLAQWPIWKILSSVALLKYCQDV